MAVIANVGGKPVAEFPDGTSPDVVQRVVKGIVGGKYSEQSKNPLNPTGMMERMIQPKSATPTQPSAPFRPVRNLGASMAEGVNLGAAGVASGLNTMYNYLNDRLKMGARPDFFKKAVEMYNSNAQYWENIAKKGGVSTALHFLGKAIGEAPAGIADFAAGVGPAAVKGAAKAKEKGKSEVVGAAKGAAERFMMGKVLHQTGKLTPVPRMGASAGVFGAQTAAQGGTPEQIGEAAITGAMYGIPGGKGNTSVRDLGKAAVDINKEMGQKGAITIDPKESKAKAEEIKQQLKGEETPLWLDRGYVPAVRVDDNVHMTGIGHDAMKDIPGMREAKELEMGWVNVKTGKFTNRMETDWESNQPKLVPAVRRGKTVTKGEVGDTHPDVMKAHDIGPDAEHERGFVGPDGKFMTRARAKQWMKKNNPELYDEWVKTVEEEGEGKKKELHSQDLNKAQGLPAEKGKKDNDPTLGMGLGGAHDTILKGLDRWLSPTKEHLHKHGENKAPAEEWIKRVEAWGSKNPHIKDENMWNGLTAWLDSKKGEKGGVQKSDIMGFLELSKGNWAVREQVYGEVDKKKAMEEMKELDRKMAKEGINDADMERYGRLYDSLEDRGDDPWADRNVPGGVPETAKVYTLSLPPTDPYGTKYTSPHFDNPDVVIHFRTQEIMDSKGEKGLLIETIQSDWHQERGTGDSSVPPAPFERTWAEVGLKHALDIAAQDPNVKWVGWSSGKVQNERWGKGENVDVRELPEYEDIVDDYVHQVSKEYADRHDGKYPNEEDDILQDAILDEADSRAVAALEKRAGSGGFLTTLYDKRLPKFAKKYVGKMGGVYKDDELNYSEKVENKGGLRQDEFEERMKLYPPEEKQYPIHRIDLTDQFRSHINTKGQEFYQMTGPVAGAVAKAAMGGEDEKKKGKQSDYDMEGYIAKYGKAKAKGEHYPDEFKLPNHITFSTDSKYSNEKTKGGVWKKDGKGRWHYTPSKWVLSQHPIKELQWYFKKYEPKSILDIPKGGVQ